MGFQPLIPKPTHLGLLIGTMVDSNRTLIGIAYHLWPTFDLHCVVDSGFRTLIRVYLGHDLLSFSHIGFQNHL